MSIKELAALDLSNEELGVLVRLMADDPSKMGNAYASEMASRIARKHGRAIAKYRHTLKMRAAAATARWEKPSSESDAYASTASTPLSPVISSLRDQQLTSNTSNTEDHCMTDEVFGAFWSEVLKGPAPLGVGKKAARKHLDATVHTEEDLARLYKALEFYRKSKTPKDLREGYVQYASTWTNKWEDYAVLADKEQEKKAGNVAQFQKFCDMKKARG